ncbi:hypothetical protein [Halococcus thailandensis]|uniref:Uncharacterized protein n=1 Tax=Halococcus thailandensis JCM 13552 TaxID=1227457 RepID=M0N6S3_9EURY|nr:hypothetical protein [Halococcus thailandensis]EMA52834.1 hypothetical protein C451_10445 [Halococcus thailandensis JCM 13552]
MFDRKGYRLGVAVVFLLVFAVSSGIMVVAGYGVVAIDTELLASAVVAALLSLYGFYRMLTGFVENGSTERTAG